MSLFLISLPSIILDYVAFPKLKLTLDKFESLWL